MRKSMSKNGELFVYNLKVEYPNKRNGIVGTLYIVYSIINQPPVTWNKINIVAVYHMTYISTAAMIKLRMFYQKFAVNSFIYFIDLFDHFNVIFSPVSNCRGV